MELNFVFIIIVGIALLVSSWIILYNYFTAPRINNLMYDLVSVPYVSVLIPVRNEQKNIENCIMSVLDQHYNNYELIVLDDDSKDITVDIVKSFADRNTHIKLIHGKKLPPGWLGKNWACKQLADEASGELLLFIDADVRLEENSINSALHKMQTEKVDLLSVFPTQIMKNPGEYLIVPLMNWLLLSFLPLKKVYSSGNKSFVAANGQFMLFKRELYNRLGGHESVKSQVVEDMEFARLTKEGGDRLLTALGNDTIYCRMYDGLGDAFEGFTKNFFPGFKTNKLNFILILCAILLIYFVPVILSFIDIVFINLVFLILLNRFLISYISNQNPLLAMLHPFQMLILFLIGFSSLTSKVEWKGRKIS